MAEDVYQRSFAIACAERGAAYVQARDAILGLEPASRRGASKALEQTIAAPGDWQTRLTAEILVGWLSAEETFSKGDQYVRGDLPGPVPVPGFTVRHRIEAIAGLGTGIVPRLLERVWKTSEYGDGVEQATLFGALQRLVDPRAVMHMITLIEDPRSSPDVQSSAASVLSVIGDPRGLQPVVTLATNPVADANARMSAIRCLGRFADPGSAQVLIDILQRTELPLDDRRAAADGLLTRSDPSTQPVVMNVLQAEPDRLIRFTLIQVMGKIGTPAVIPALRQLAAGNAQLEEQIDDAIEDIKMRAR